MAINALSASALITGKNQPNLFKTRDFPHNGKTATVHMRDTIVSRMQRALINILESPASSTDQKLTASAQLVAIKKVKPRTRKPHKPRLQPSKSSVLGTT